MECFVRFLVFLSFKCDIYTEINQVGFFCFLFFNSPLSPSSVASSILDLKEALPQRPLSLSPERGQEDVGITRLQTAAGRFRAGPFLCCFQSTFTPRSLCGRWGGGCGLKTDEEMHSGRESGLPTVMGWVGPPDLEMPHLLLLAASP